MSNVSYSGEMVVTANLKDLHLCTLDTPSGCVQGTLTMSMRLEVEALMMKILKEELSSEDYEKFLKDLAEMKK